MNLDNSGLSLAWFWIAPGDDDVWKSDPFAKNEKFVYCLYLLEGRPLFCKIT